MDVDFPLFIAAAEKGEKNQMKEAVGGYEGVRKVWIYFISCFLALWQLFVVYQLLGCAWAVFPGNLAIPGAMSILLVVWTALRWKGHAVQRVVSMLQRCLYNAEDLKDQARPG